MNFCSLACSANLLLLFLRKLNFQGINVFLQSIQVGCSRDLACRQSLAEGFFTSREPTYREYVTALMKQPRQGQLGGRGILLFC